jgi:hypothetical protein
MGAINLARLSELEWRRPPPKRKPWIAFLLIGMGLAMGYYFLTSGNGEQDASAPPQPLLGTSAESPPTAGQQPHSEMSTIAAIGANPQLAHNETSAIASAPSEVHVINAPREGEVLLPRQPNPALTPEDSSAGKEHGYANLRREFLRHLR